MYAPESIQRRSSVARTTANGWLCCCSSGYCRHRSGGRRSRYIARVETGELDACLRRELVEELGTTFTRVVAAIDRALARSAAAAGRRLVPSAGRMPLLWAIVNGVGDQLVDGRHRLHDCDREEFLAFSARGLVAAIATPAD